MKSSLRLREARMIGSTIEVFAVGSRLHRVAIAKNRCSARDDRTRLELFARKLSPGWYAWGHEIAESLLDQSAA